jgi:hypothetical protein
MHATPKTDPPHRTPPRPLEIAKDTPTGHLRGIPAVDGYQGPTEIPAGVASIGAVEKAPPQPSIVIGLGIWLTVGLIYQWQEFKGAPKYIEFIDP